MRHLMKLTLICLLLFSAVAVQAQAALCTEKGGVIDTATGDCLITEATDTYEISIAYPVDFVEDYPFTEATIDSYIESAQTNFAQIIEDTPTEDLPGPLQMTIAYEVYSYFGEFVGIRFNRLEYTGGANPILLVDTFSFNVDDEELIALSDLFQPDTDYLAVIQPLALEALIEEFGEDSVFEEGLEPIDANYNSFFLYNYRLYFVFDEYQVAPGAAGTPEVIIPLFALENILSPDVIIYRKG